MQYCCLQRLYQISRRGESASITRLKMFHNCALTIYTFILAEPQLDIEESQSMHFSCSNATFVKSSRLFLPWQRAKKTVGWRLAEEVLEPSLKLSLSICSPINPFTAPAPSSVRLSYLPLHAALKSQSLGTRSVQPCPARPDPWFFFSTTLHWHSTNGEWVMRYS